MNVVEAFNFDRLGFLHLNSVIKPQILAPIAEVVDKLQPYFVAASLDPRLQPGQHGNPYFLDDATAASV
jgi:hypothetical protein